MVNDPFSCLLTGLKFYMSVQLCAAHVHHVTYLHYQGHNIRPDFGEVEEQTSDLSSVNCTARFVLHVGSAESEPICEPTLYGR